MSNLVRTLSHNLLTMPVRHISDELERDIAELHDMLVRLEELHRHVQALINEPALKKLLAPPGEQAANE